MSCVLCSPRVDCACANGRIIISLKRCSDVFMSSSFGRGGTCGTGDRCLPRIHPISRGLRVSLFGAVRSEKLRPRCRRLVCSGCQGMFCQFTLVPSSGVGPFSGGPRRDFSVVVLGGSCRVVNRAGFPNGACTRRLYFMNGGNLCVSRGGRGGPRFSRGGLMFEYFALRNQGG